MLILPLLLVFPYVLAQKCESDWTSFNGACYKHFNNKSEPLVHYMAEIKCNSFGAHLSTVSSQEELDFLGKLVRTPGTFTWSGYPLLAPLRNPGNNTWFYNFNESTQPFLKWCPTKPNNFQKRENCIQLITDDYNRGDTRAPDPKACLDDTFCEAGYDGAPPTGYFRYVCKKTAIVEKKCPEDYIDITETDVPERTKYKKGEKCIPKNPCRDLEDTTITYIVDSSQSIGSKNWKSLVQFMQSGANFLPNSTKVGFIKYSTNVTFAKFLKPVWSNSEFEKFVPSEFEDGETNTPAAFDKAREMFKKDDSRNKVAVLITDGLPFSFEHDDPNEMERITKKAAQKLQNSGVTLIALGYGNGLQGKNAKVIKSWLEDSDEDYFEYDKLACDLKSVHMSILMRKVCRRYVKY